MKYNFNKKYLYLALTLLVAACGAIVFYYLLFHSSVWSQGLRKIIRVLMPVIDGFIFAYLLNPCVYYFENSIFVPLCERMKLDPKTVKAKKRIRGLSILITLFIFGFCIYFIMLLLIPQLGESLTSLGKSLPGYVNNFSDRISLFFKDYPDIEKSIDSYLDESTLDLTKWITEKLLPHFNSVLSTGLVRILGVVRFIWNMIIGLIISIYILASKETFLAQIKKIMFALMKEKTANSLIDEVSAIHSTFGGFITGKLIDSFIIGCLCFIGATILQLPYALLISVIIGITNIIPFFGPFLGAVPCSFLVLVVDPRKCLYFLIFIVILQQVDGNLIGPKILGESTGLSGFWVIFSITIFGGLFGVVGMFVGVPIFAVIYAAIKRYTSRRLHRKNLPESTLAYMKLKHIHDGKLEYINQSFDLDEEKPKPVKIVVSLDVSEEDSEDINVEQSGIESEDQKVDLTISEPPVKENNE